MALCCVIGGIVNKSLSNSSSWDKKSVLLHPNKAHGHAKMSIFMIKICVKSICRPLELILKNCLVWHISIWLDESKHTTCSQKKSDKKCLYNYHPVSLLPIYGKSLDWQFFNEMFSFTTENDLIFQYQPNLKACINQPLFITHEIYKSFNSVFLGISKIFDKV